MQQVSQKQKKARKAKYDGPVMFDDSKHIASLHTQYLKNHTIMTNDRTQTPTDGIHRMMVAISDV